MARSVGEGGEGEPYELVKREAVVPYVSSFFVRILCSCWEEEGRADSTSLRLRICFCATFASSLPSGAFNEMQEELGGSKLVTTLAVSLFVAGYSVGELRDYRPRTPRSHLRLAGPIIWVRSFLSLLSLCFY